MNIKYRKKPVVIEAFQIPPVDPDAEHEVPVWLEEAIIDKRIVFSTLLGTVSIKTLEGFMNGVPGDWIIRGVQGELYPCKNDIFNATYEKVEEGK